MQQVPHSGEEDGVAVETIVRSNTYHGNQNGLEDMCIEVFAPRSQSIRLPNRLPLFPLPSSSVCRTHLLYEDVTSMQGDTNEMEGTDRMTEKWR